jgi:2-aminoethylphosphonate-pyruvate transaminase
MVPPHGKVLVPNNGAYCQRIARILRYLGRGVILLDHRDDEPSDPARIDAALSADPTITHVAQVHCETGTGILNPLHDIANVVHRHRRRLIVDAMSSLGAVPIDLTTMPIDAVIAASGKCLEGVPGMGFIVVRRDLMESSPGYSHSLSLDLHDQWHYMQKTGQWRFTPPTHVVAALRVALDQFLAEGGVAARGARYRANCLALTQGMLLDVTQSPIIVTFHAPENPAYRFEALYRGVREKGFILYPGKLTQIETFRVGCIGAIEPEVIRQAVNAIARTMHELGLQP